MSSRTASPGDSPQTPAGVFTSVLGGVIEAAATKLESKVGQWADKLEGGTDRGDRKGALAPLVETGLDEVAAHGGPAENAAAQGVKAHWQGNNPIWAAVRGAWESGTPAVRAAIVTAAAAAVFLVVLSPVLCLVFLLSLLVIAAVHRAGQAKT
jgi:hypothetical protein